MSALCPLCLSHGPLGSPCETDLCLKLGKHRIPPEHAHRCRTLPGDDDGQSGRLVDDYLIVRRLGQGGFGSVYLALQMPLAMPTALKMLRTADLSEADKEQFVQRFALEALTLSRLSHPNIVRLLKFGGGEETHYLVMEYVAGGRELRHEIEARRKSRQGFSPNEVRIVATQLLHALSAAHKEGIVHRDVKPANVMLQPVEGNPLLVRVLDFGLVKLLSHNDDSTMRLGTPTYMAPEQHRGREIGPWTDLYALGLMIGEMLLGQRPFNVRSLSELVDAKLNSDHTPKDVFGTSRIPRSLERFLRKAIAPACASRFRSVEEFLPAMNAMFERLDDDMAQTAEPCDDTLDAESAENRRTQLWSPHSDALAETMSPEPDRRATAQGGFVPTEPMEKSPHHHDASLSDLPTEPPPYSRGSTGKWRWAAVAAALLLLPLATWLTLSSLGSGDNGPADAKPGDEAAETSAPMSGQVGPTAPAGNSAPKVWKDVPLASALLGNQEHPSVSALKDGTLLAVWSTADPSTGESRIVGRYFQATSPTGAEFRICSADRGTKRVPVVATLTDGRALVLWSAEGLDGSGWGVYGQWLSPKGEKIRGEFLVNTDRQDGDQELPAITVLPDDRVLVAWQSAGPDGDGFGILGQWFGADGQRAGAPVVLNSQGQGRQRFPTLAAGSESVLVAWESESTAESDSFGIQARIVSPTGTELRPQFLVNHTMAGRQRYPAAAPLPGGGFLVAWTSENQDGSRHGIYARTLDRFGASQSEEFPINTTTEGDQWVPKVASSANGTSLVVWLAGAQDGSGQSVVGRFISGDGGPLGDEFLVNDYSELDQRVRSVTALPDGDFFCAWESMGQDGSGWGVFGAWVSLPGSIK